MARRKEILAARKDLTDAAAMRDYYAAMPPHMRESFLRDNPDFRTSDHSALTVLQWREHARLHRARGTDAAAAYADAIRAAGFQRPTRSDPLGRTRGGAAFLTLCGLAMKGVVILPCAWAAGGAPMLIIMAIAFGIYATALTLGSIISARAL